MGKKVSAGSHAVVKAVKESSGVTSKLKVGPATTVVESDRVRDLNSKPEGKGKYVLYWVQAAPRWSYNHALQFAKQAANRLGVPLVCCFGVTAYPEANERMYTFMLEGLAALQAHLKTEGIQFVVKKQPPPKLAKELAAQACLVVTDMGYLNIQRLWRAELAKSLKVKLVQVETDAAVPVETASNKREFAARTLRPKIMKLLGKYLHPLTPAKVAKSSLGIKLKAGKGSADLSKKNSVQAFLKGLKPLDRSVKPVGLWFTGGAKEASLRLKEFVKNRLPHYGEHRNEPDKKYASDLSPYYHFGHISPIEAAVAVMQSSGPKTGKEGFVEEGVVRRELSLNFCHFDKNYDNFNCLPPWAQKTLKQHQKDKRKNQYTLKQLETAKTGDEVWDAAQKEMLVTGKMANYMRMYWGKKVLEWAPTPQIAFKWLLYLNNKYELDGRDPNSYAGVAWVFGNHDRPWQKTPCFGMVRYMGQPGMYTKFNMASYFHVVEQYAKGVREPKPLDKKGKRPSSGKGAPPAKKKRK